MRFNAIRSKISSLLVLAMLLSTLLPLTALGATVQMKDLADSYAQKEIQSLVEAGIISGYEDNSFQPKKVMTRAELAKIIVLSLGLKENTDKASPFKDVDSKSWYRGFVGALVDSGITQGTSDTTFSPESKVTREELVVFFIRAFGLEDTAKNLKADANFSDITDVSVWAKAHVSLAFKLGFVNGIANPDGSLKFSPKENAERQALARLTYEFKTNKTKYTDKAKELATAKPGEQTPATTGDGTITNPDDSKSTSGTSGNSSSSTSRDRKLSDVSVINNGGTINSSNVTLGAGIYGPASGTAVINGTLTLDPGATGEVTLNNVQVSNVVVASGAPNSVHLNNVKITLKLTINTGGQTATVHIVVDGNTTIAATDVNSKATLEVDQNITGAGFGDITIKLFDANQMVDLIGNIIGKITVAGPQAAGLNIYGNVGTIQSESVVTINANQNAQINQVQLTNANSNVTLTGTGAFLNILTAMVGAVITIGDEVQVTNLKIDQKVDLRAKTDVLIKINIQIPANSNVGDMVLSNDTNMLNALMLGIAREYLDIKYNNDDSESSITSNVTLPVLGKFGSSVSWSSNHNDVISNTGVVTLPASDVKVTLTATITLSTGFTFKEFIVTVKAPGNVQKPSISPSTADIRIFNYATGDDEVHIFAVGGSKAKVYSATSGGTLLGSADSVANGGGAFANVIITGGLGNLTDIYATVTEIGKAESMRVAQTVPLIPAAPQVGDITITNTVYEARIRVANVPAGANVFIYDNATSRAPISFGQNTSATAAPIETVVANNLSTAYVAIQKNGGESSRTAAPVQLTVQSISPLSDIQVASGTALNAAGLPTQIQITLSDSTTKSVPVTWDSGTPAYDANRVGTYSFTATPDLSGSPNVAGTNLKAAVNVVVEFATGLGTVSDPYIVKTLFQLNNVRKYLSAYFKLDSDIDLNVAPYNQGEGWLPIGQTKFQGSFDGNGHIIRNLFINRPTKSGGGLFAVVGETGKIDNVKLENVSVSATHNTGGLVAIIYPGGLVSNSSVTGSVVSTNLNLGGQLGGLVGFNYGGTVTNSQASVTVTGKHRLGGLVGNNWGVIKHSRVTASTITGEFLVGGLAGMSYTDGTVTSVVYAVIETSSADAIVTGTAADSLAGGLVGENAGGTLSNNYTTGSVTGNKYVGGLTGRSGNFLAYPGAVEKSYAANSVTGTSSVGGLVGEKLSGQVVNSYYDSVTTGKTDTDRGTPKTTAEMKQISTFPGWDFTNIWTIPANQYPQLH